MFFFFFKQKTAYEMRISDWSSDVCSSDLAARVDAVDQRAEVGHLEVDLGDAHPLEDDLGQLWSLTGRLAPLLVAVGALVGDADGDAVLPGILQQGAAALLHRGVRAVVAAGVSAAGLGRRHVVVAARRSEERRVGKELARTVRTRRATDN